MDQLRVHEPILRVTEELLLLIMDAGSGGIRYAFPAHQRDLVIAGAALMDLALENRIDTDAERLFLINPKPLGDDLLDPVLADIVGETETHDTAYWVMRTARRGSALRKQALDRLIERGILEAEPNGLVFLSRLVARARRYPTVGGEIRADVQSRVLTAFSATTSRTRATSSSSASQRPAACSRASFRGKSWPTYRSE